MYTISSSDGTSLHFPDLPLKMEYEHASKMLDLTFYIKARNRYGVWAGNQNKFVETVYELNEMDPRHMEMLLSRHEEELEIEIEPHRGRVKLNGKV